MVNPTRDDIETAAARYFAMLRDEVDQPRGWTSDELDHALRFNLDETQNRIAELSEQLLTNDFDDGVGAKARQMLSPLSVSLDALSSQLRTFALQLAARAERQQMLYFGHVLRDPVARYTPDDEVFAAIPSDAIFPDSVASPTRVATSVSLVGLPQANSSTGMSLGDLVENHKAAMIDQALSESHVIEFERVARWVLGEFGSRTPIASISTASLRGFRDKLRSIDGTVRSGVRNGLKSLDESLTTNRERQIRSETARRYWAYVKAMFARAVSEGFLDHDPSSSLTVPLRKDEERQSPEPYSTEELKRLFALPVFTGRLSQARQKVPGNCRVRDGYFWSCLLQAYTGMRGAEVSQLLPEDFVFDAEVPHLLVRKENEHGAKVKTVKNKSSVRAVPIADDLLILGLRQFVQGRKSKRPNQRLLHEFPTGSRGKKSDGLSKFWRRYIDAFGLHKEGRALHVWRHTVTLHLRQRGVSDEDIGYLLGHRVQSETARYGPGELTQRIRDRSLARLDYGFDLVALVGGPYNPQIHAE